MNYTKAKKEFDEEQKIREEQERNLEYIEAMKEIGIEVNEVRVNVFL